MDYTWFFIITLTSGLAVFSLCDPQIRVSPFIFAPLLSCFMYVYISRIVDGYYDPFLIMHIIPILLISFVTNLFWGLFIFFLRHTHPLTRRES